MRVLILGGYGVFGGRLAELLADCTGLEMLICGRHLQRAEAFCQRFQGAASVRPMQLDRQALASQIASVAPDLVVDASGPFQTYVNPYQVIETCIRAGVHYMDFADAADFVFGVSQFDQRARAAGVVILSGVSSFPVLTAAVLREMAKDMPIETVQGGIAPSPFAGVGLNVMRAVVGYAGGPVRLTRNGVQTTAPGLAESLRYTVAVPGRMPLRNIRFSLVDVPDLQVLPPAHPGLRDIWMGAGPGPEGLHRILNLLAKARYHLRLPSFAPFAPLFYRVLNLMRFGEHRGGMFVHVTGGGQKRSWHLLAEGDDGPYIPSMAIEALVRKMLAGQMPDPGARPASDALNLADYDQLFKARRIYAGFRSTDPTAPLYRQVLGDAFDTLPPQLRALHGDTGPRCWEGVAQVRRGNGWVSRLIGRVFGFPPEADAIPVSVQFTPAPKGETWVRRFGTMRFSSDQTLGTARDTHLLVERFGWIKVGLALVIEDGRLFFVPLRWSVLGVPLPGWLLPRGRSFEEQSDGQFRFNVEISAPWIGLIVAYRGTLACCAGADRAPE